MIDYHIGVVVSLLANDKTKLCKLFMYKTQFHIH